MDWYLLHYNQNIKVDVDDEILELYSQGEEIYNETLKDISKVCVVNQENDSDNKYILDTKYSNDEDYELINYSLCYKTYEILDNSLYNMNILNQVDNYSYHNLDGYINNIKYNDYDNLKDTKYEIVEAYSKKLRESESERYGNVDYWQKDYMYKSDGKEKIIDSFKVRLNCELDELKFLKIVVNYFENELEKN